MKHFAIALVLSVVAFAAPAHAESLSFKGAVLGESLQDFKGQFPTYSGGFPDAMQCVTGDDARIIGYHLTPLSRQYIPWSVLHVIKHMKKDEVTCSSSNFIATAHGVWSNFGDRYPDGLKIGTALAEDVNYQFLGGRLYKIDIEFSAVQLSNMLAAFSGKYGAPSVSTTDHVTSSGVQWQGHTYIWENGTQVINLVEGKSNGPEQTEEFDSYVLIQDLSITSTDTATNF